MKVFDKDDPTTSNVEPGSELPDELKGKSQEEQYNLLKGEHNRLMTEEKARKFDALQAQPPVTPAATPPARQAPSTPQKGTHDGVQPPTSYRQPAGEERIDPLENPEGFMQQQFDQRVNPMINATVNSVRATNRELYTQNNAKDFEEFGEEIEQFVSALAPQLQMDPRAYKQGAAYVKSLHLDEIIEKEATARSAGGLAKTLAAAGVSEEDIAQIVAATAANGERAAAEPAPAASLFGRATGLPPRVASTVTTPPKQPVGGGTGSKLTPKEKELADEFGMTDAEWAVEREGNTDIVSSLRREGI